MPKNKKSDYIQLAIAAARAAYGDFTGAITQGVKYMPQIICILLAVILVVVVLPVLLIQSLFSGDNNSTSGAFPETAIQVLKYKEDWIPVLAAVQTKKAFSNTSQANLNEAYQAVKNNTVESYLRNDPNSKDTIMKIYDNNLELLKNLLVSYAGYNLYYDKIPVPSSFESIDKVYKPDLDIHVLEATIKTNDSKEKKTIYSSNDVVNYRVAGNMIKVKCMKYGLKAYFPIPRECASSFSDDFGSERDNDGQNTSHEGIDIFAARNAPIVSVEDCVISKIGWNGLGGWRITLESVDGLRVYYYAHMENYSPALQKYKDISGRVYDDPGIEVKRGEIIGYVGSSGSFNSNTPPGADTGTPPHLHFQLWIKSQGWFSGHETLINPYYCLRLLENNKYGEDIKLNQQKLEMEGL